MPRHLRALDKSLLNSVNACEDLYCIRIDSLALGAFYQFTLCVVKLDFFIIIDIFDFYVSVLTDNGTVLVSKRCYSNERYCESSVVRDLKNGAYILLYSRRILMCEY